MRLYHDVRVGRNRRIIRTRKVTMESVSDSLGIRVELERDESLEERLNAPIVVSMQEFALRRQVLPCGGAEAA